MSDSNAAGADATPRTPDMDGNKERHVLRLPPEILAMIFAYHGATTRNVGHYRSYYIYIDYLEASGLRRAKAPEFPPIARTCHAFREIQRMVLFRNAIIEIIHDDVCKTVQLHCGLTRSERNAISVLYIEYVRGKPVNYTAFRELCKILYNMSSLKIL